MSFIARQEHDRRDALDAVLRGAILLENEIHFLERDESLRLAISSSTWRAINAVSGAPMVCVNNSSVTGCCNHGKVLADGLVDPVRTEAHVISSRTRAFQNLNKIVERFSRVVVARRRGFALDGRSRRKKRAAIAGVLGRDALRDRLGMHSNRLPGSNDAHCAHAWSSTPHLEHRLLNPMSSGASVPALGAADDVPEPGHVDVLGPSCEIRRAPAGAPGSGRGTGPGGRGARSRSSS